MSRIISTLIDWSGRIPLRAGYIFSDTIAWIAGDVVRYRRKVIMDNLRKSFPEKPEKELRGIARRFYHWLSDYFVETMRLGHMSEDEIRRRMTFENIELVNGFAEKGVPVAIMLGHFCNWEWISSMPLHLSEACDPSQIYHPLENKDADMAFTKIRTRFGAQNVAMGDAPRYLLRKRTEGKATVTGYIADQAPGYNATHLWLDFLNHETGVFTGPEHIQRKMKGAMVYAHIERPERGRYHCRFELISENVAAEPEFEPTRRYFSLLEDQIRKTPHLWLWSHRRWKRPRLNDTNQVTNQNE